MKLALVFNAAVGLGAGVLAGAVALTIGAPLTAIGTAVATATVVSAVISGGAGFICGKAFDGKGPSAGVAGLFLLAAANLAAVPAGVVTATAVIQHPKSVPVASQPVQHVAPV